MDLTWVIAASVVVLLFVAYAATDRRARADALRDRQTLHRIEAKLDALLAHHQVAFDASKDILPAVSEALQRGQVIDAIRRYRDATGADLADAKRYVDDAKRRLGMG